MGKTYRKYLSVVLTLLLTAAMFAFGPVSARADAQFPIVESFTGNSAPGWAWGGGASLGGGWMTLTRALDGQMGYAYYTEPFPSSLGIVVEFDYATWGGNGADGTSFFLFDGSTAFSPGPVGGALGYAARPSQGQTGVGHAYVGIGLDEFGNFSNPGDGLIDGPGFFPNNVVIRGAGNGTAGYNFLTRAATPLAANRTSPSHIQMTITKDKKITVRRMAPGANTYTTLINGYQMTTTPPATFKLGFVASTGALTNNHEIRNLTVAAPVELPLTLSSSVGAAKVGPGQAITYTATVTNTGLNDANGAAIALSASGLENITWTCAAGSGGACASASGTGDAGLNLPTGASATLTIQANVAAAASGSVSFTATAQAPAGFVNTSNSASATLTNQVVARPTALPQTVSLEMNSSRAITLTGTDPQALPLTYTMTQPAHGTLSGSAPDLTYTAAPGYFGSDSFDFTVNNGYVESAPATVTINVVDTILPTITGAPDRQPDHNGWYNQPVTVSFTCQDSGSGIAACTQPATLTDGAGQMVSGEAMDNAGNKATAEVGPLNVDTTAPTIQGAPDRAANSYGWYNAPVTVTFTCADGLSGVATCSGPATLSAEAAGQSATGSVTDMAGNSASATVAPINIDMTAPTVTFSGAGTYTVDQMVSITCSATDSLSGIAASTCADVTGSAYSLGLGSHTLSATATDKAGNTGSGSATYTVVVTADSLCRLTHQFVTQDGIANSLCAKLSASAQQAAQGNTKAADNILAAYINEVSAQTGKAIGAMEAGILTQLANALMQ